MPNKELGIADPVYDALRIRSGQSIAPDLGGGSTGTGGIENKIYVWHADGSTVDTFEATAAGLALAITAAATNDTIWLPSIAIALTAGVTLPASVTVRGISNRATLAFSGFSGDAVTLSSGSVLQDCTVTFSGTGATARGIVASGVGCDIVSCSSLVSGATTNIGAELTGADIDTSVNTLNLYGSGSGGTTAIGLQINDFVHAEHTFGQAGSASTRNSGVSFACTSAVNAGWFITGYGNASGTASAGMEVEVNKFANIIDGFARGVTCGLLIGAGATAIVFALQWSSLCNSGTLTESSGSGAGSGDATYLRLDTSNKPLTGPLTFLNPISGAGINLDNVHDGSTINASTNGAMFASFDAQVTVNGATDYNHIASLQDRTIYNGSGSLTSQWGYLSWPENSGSGTLIGRYGVMIFDVGGAGPVTNNYGVYVSALSRGANNYALWVENNLSHFGGIVEVKPTGTAGLRLDPNSATGNFLHSISPANLTANHRATLQNADGTLAYLTDVPSTLNDLSDVDTTGEATGDVIYDNGGTWQVYPLGIGSRITVSGTKIRFGNVTGGNYLEIDSVTGTLRLVGDATTWDDFRVEASVVKPGATAPQYKAFGPSGNLQALMFEAGHHDEAMFEVQMPHNWLLGSNIYPHVHWTPTTADAGNVVWELEYSWSNVGDAFGAPSNMATDPTAAGGTAWVHKLTDFKSGGNNYIDGTGKTLSSMLVCRLHRNSNSGSDTLNKDVALLEVDFHYQIDSLGSDERLVKDASASLLLESGDILLLESGDRLLLEQ